MLPVSLKQKPTKVSKDGVFDYVSGHQSIKVN